MAIIQKILNLVKRKDRFSALLSVRNTQIRNFNPLIIVAFLVLFSGLFLVVSNTIAKKINNILIIFRKLLKIMNFLILQVICYLNLTVPMKKLTM